MSSIAVVLLPFRQARVDRWCNVHFILWICFCRMSSFSAPLPGGAFHWSNNIYLHPCSIIQPCLSRPLGNISSPYQQLPFLLLAYLLRPRSFGSRSLPRSCTRSGYMVLKRRKEVERSTKKRDSVKCELNFVKGLILFMPDAVRKGKICTTAKSGRSKRRYFREKFCHFSHRGFSSLQRDRGERKEESSNKLTERLQETSKNKPEPQKKDVRLLCYTL